MKLNAYALEKKNHLKIPLPVSAGGLSLPMEYRWSITIKATKFNEKKGVSKFMELKKKVGITMEYHRVIQV